MYRRNRTERDSRADKELIRMEIYLKGDSEAVEGTTKGKSMGKKNIISEQAAVSPGEAQKLAKMHMVMISVGVVEVEAFRPIQTPNSTIIMWISDTAKFNYFK